MKTLVRHTAVALLTVLLAVAMTNCEPYTAQLAALSKFGGHGPPAGYDFTPISFSGRQGTDPQTGRWVTERNPLLNDRSFPTAAGYLREMPNLWLDLSYTDISDKSVPAIGQLDLLHLDVAGTRITPRALLQLRGRREKLTYLGFSGNGVASQDISALQDALQLPFASYSTKDNRVDLTRSPPTTRPSES